MMDQQAAVDDFASPPHLPLVTQLSLGPLMIVIVVCAFVEVNNARKPNVAYGTSCWYHQLPRDDGGLSRATTPISRFNNLGPPPICGNVYCRQPAI